MTPEAKAAMQKKVKAVFTDDQVIALDYVAKCAAMEVVQLHTQECPFKIEVQQGITRYALIGLATIGSLLIALGAILYGWWKAKNGGICQ
jgi:phosphoribosylanthranilate isomerase